MEYPFKDLLPLDEVLAREGYYKDWTHIDADTFHQISELVKFIREKGYGSDTREAIAQALERVYHDATQSGDANMEVSMARKHFENLASRLDASDYKLTSAAAQLAQKVGDGKLATMADLSQGVKEAMTGGSVAVVGKSAVNDLNLSEGITLSKFKDVDIVATNNNLVDPYKLKMGGFYHPTTGVWTDDELYASSDFTKLGFGESYYLKGNDARAVTHWDKDYNFISGSQATSNGLFTIPNNVNIVYTVVTVSLVGGFDATNLKVTRLGNTNTTDNKYDYRYLLNKKFLYEGDVDISQTNLLRNRPTSNVFNPSKRLLNGFYSIVNGSWTVNAGFDSTEFINVKANEVYYKHVNSGGVAFFNKDKEFITGFGQDGANFITVPDNRDIAYMTMPVRKDFINEIMIVKTTKIPETYIPYTDDELLIQENIKIDADNLTDDLKDALSSSLGITPPQPFFTNQYTDDINIQEGYHHKYGTSFWVTRVNKNTFDGGVLIPKVKLTAHAITSSTTTDVVTHVNNNNNLLTINAGVLNPNTGRVDGLFIMDGAILQDEPISFHTGMCTLGIKSTGDLKSYPSTVTATELLADGCLHAFVAFIPLVEDGQKVAQSVFETISAYNTPHPRQIIGQLENGDYIIATFDGRIEGQRGITLPEAADIMLSYGCKFAFNLDGGGSTQTFVGKKRINRLIENRKVPNVIVFEKQP